MSWLSELIKKVVRKEKVDFVRSDPLGIGAAQPIITPLVADENYVSVVVKQLRLPYTRVATTKLYGVVHSFVRLQRLGQGAVDFACATTPARLAGVDPKGIANALTISKRVMGPAPWRGGSLSLETGLFSVVSENLAGPFLDTLTSLSEKVGVSFATAAAPFIDVIRTGAVAMTRASNSVALEVGLDEEFTPPQACIFALVAAPVGELDKAKLSVDAADYRLKYAGADYTKKPYMVIAIEASSQRDDWAEIPDLREAYDAVVKAVRDGKQDEAETALNAFSRRARTSSDLIAHDAERLIKKVDAVVHPPVKSPVGGAVASRSLPEFADLDLYDEAA